MSSRTALSTIHYVELATILRAASTGLLTSVTLRLRFRLTVSTLGQRKYQPSCLSKGFATAANYETKICYDIAVVGEEQISHILVKLSVTNVSTCNGNNGKTRGIKHLQASDIGASR